MSDGQQYCHSCPLELADPGSFCGVESMTRSLPISVLMYLSSGSLTLLGAMISGYDARRDLTLLR